MTVQHDPDNHEVGRAVVSIQNPRLPLHGLTQPLQEHSGGNRGPVGVPIQPARMVQGQARGLGQRPGKRAFSASRAADDHRPLYRDTPGAPSGSPASRASITAPTAPSRQWHTTRTPEESTSSTAFAGAKAASARRSMGRSFMWSPTQ